MPRLIETNTDVRPTLVLDPNARFGATYLSNRYRAYSVKGETLQDKQTGEMFIRRPEDGKVLSFFQNKKYMYDLMLELRVLVTNNEWITLPTSKTAFYVAPDFDLMEFNGSLVNDITTNNTTFGDGLTFNISKETNGFFIRPNTRDTDKPVVEYATNVYNNFIQNYNGSNATLNEEKSRFDDPTWEDSNIILTYDLTITSGEVTRTYNSLTHFVRFNEVMGVQIPEEILATDFPGGFDEASVTINSLDYHKLHFLLEHMDLFPNPEVIEENIDMLICVDGEIQAQYMMVQYFVDDISDVIITGKEVLVALLDVPYVRRYMSKMSKLKDNSDFILATNRPFDDDWPANSIWAEWFREVGENGVTLNHNSVLNMEILNEFYSSGTYIRTNFAMGTDDPEAIAFVEE